jgi:hypothetical protein
MRDNAGAGFTVGPSFSVRNTMKRALTVFSTIAILVLDVSTAGNSTAATLQASPKLPMSIKVLAVTGPHVITKNGQLIAVRVRFTGIVMDPLHIGQKSVVGHGHMQVYLNRIPSSAYKYAAPADVVVNATTSTFNFALSPHWRKAARGHHRFLVALARNDNILYRVNAGSFSLTVK